MKFSLPCSAAERVSLEMLRDVTSVFDALSICQAWHSDAPPAGSTGSLSLDLRLSDAFRMLIYLDDPRAQLDWLHREVRSLHSAVGMRTADPYETVIMRWWLELYEQFESRAETPGYPRNPASARWRHIPRPPSPSLHRATSSEGCSK